MFPWPSTFKDRYELGEEEVDVYWISSLVEAADKYEMPCVTNAVRVAIGYILTYCDVEDPDKLDVYTLCCEQDWQRRRGRHRSICSTTLYLKYWIQSQRSGSSLST